jgi:drug/metabolite transporter (DMT)-like permease
MISAAGYLALARRNRDTSSIWLYITPLYWIAGLVSALATLAAGLLWEIPAGRTLLGELRLGDSAPLAIASWSDAAAVAALVLVPTIGGHTILNWSMKHFRGQTVSLTNLAQFVFATAMGMVWLRPPEFPDWLSFGPAAAMVLGGAVLALLTTPSDRSEVGIPESSSAAGDA